MEYFCRPINLSISAVNEENALTLDIAQDIMHFCLCSKKPCKHLSDLGGKGREGSGVCNWISGKVNQTLSEEGFPFKEGEENSSEALENDVFEAVVLDY